METVQPKVSRRRSLWIAAGVAWVAAVVAGFAFLADYDNRPGAPARAPERWPGESAVILDAARPTLVMLAHPRCTCTRASLTELAELLARAKERPRTYVVFVKPGGTGVDWEHTDLWRTAAAMPDVTVLRDDAGVEAKRFGAETSGQVLLYAPNGTLVFSGGATGARAHPGDNLGRASIVALLNHERTIETTTPVFGCSLFGALDPDREATPHDDDHK